jgi:hypothetical protein
MRKFRRMYGKKNFIRKIMGNFRRMYGKKGKLKKWWIHGSNHAPLDSKEVNLPPQYTYVNIFDMHF